MIAFTRTAAIAPGKNAGAMAFAHEVCAHIKDKHGLTVDTSIPVGGNPNRIAWRATYASLAEFETSLDALMTDQAYAAVLAKAADLFSPGSVHDEIWRSV